MVPLSFWPPMFGPLSRSLKKMTGPPEFGLGGGGGGGGGVAEVKGRDLGDNRNAGGVGTLGIFGNKKTPRHKGGPENNPFSGAETPARPRARRSGPSSG